MLNSGGPHTSSLEIWWLAWVWLLIILTLTYQCLLYYEAVSVTLSIVISFVHHICPANEFLTLSVATVGILYWSNHLLSYCLMLFLNLHTCRSQSLNFARVCWTPWMSVSRYTNLLVDELAWSRNRKSIMWYLHQEINHLLNMWCIWVWGDHSVKYCKWLLWIHSHTSQLWG